MQKRKERRKTELFIDILGKPVKIIQFEVALYKNENNMILRKAKPNQIKIEARIAVAILAPNHSEIHR